MIFDTEKQKQKNGGRKRKSTFKLADCVSMMDVVDTTPEHLGLFMYVVDKCTEVRSNETARFKR